MTRRPLHELDQRLDLRERLGAIIAELEILNADIDVPHTLASALLEDIDGALAEERRER